jgi:GDP-D-mannose dehydratase
VVGSGVQYSVKSFVEMAFLQAAKIEIRWLNTGIDEVGVDAEDTYQAVQRFNKLEDIALDYDDDGGGYVEPIEKISNQQYKNQLPD